MLDKGYHFVAALPSNKKWLPFMTSVQQLPESFNFRGTRYRAKVKGVKISSCWCHLVVYFDHKKAKRESIKRERALKEAEHELEELKGKLNRYRLKTRDRIKAKVKEILKKHGVSRFLQVKVMKPRGGDKFTLSFQRRAKGLNHQTKRDGRFMLITDHRDLTPKDLLSDYRSKHSVESAFSIIKGPIKLRPVFVYSEQRIKGHIFICVLALFLRCLLNYLLKLASVDLTPERALKQLKQVRLTKIVVKDIDQTFHQLTKIEPERQRIFDAVGLSPPKILNP